MYTLKHCDGMGDFVPAADDLSGLRLQLLHQPDGSLWGLKWPLVFACHRLDWVPDRQSQSLLHCKLLHMPVEHCNRLLPLEVVLQLESRLSH